jgi:YrbI family 3-deoxy-D-manno-octulosonate 8-phosphate phosphatase
MADRSSPEAFQRAFLARTRSVRRAAGLSRAEAARRLGIDPDAYAAFETRSLLPHHLIAAFARLVGVPLASLLAEDIAVSTGVASLRRKLPRRPAALIMDFDGVFTDNKVTVHQDGRESVRCDRSDGLGLQRLAALGLPLLVLSKEQNPVVGARCRKLGIECLQGIDDKRPALEAWCGARRFPLADTIYVGNDINDLSCFAAVGCAVAVADAHPEVLAAADLILNRPGGRGALRELADALAVRLGGG